MASVDFLCASIVLCIFMCGYQSIQGQVIESGPSFDAPPLLNYGLEKGDRKINDLSGDTEVNLGTNISFFGSNYNKLYISVDGLISFQRNMRYIKNIVWREGTRSKTTDKPFIAPFFYDGFQALNVQQNNYKGGIFYRVLDADELKSGTQFYFENSKTLEWLTKYVKETTINIPVDFKADFVVIVTWSNVLSESDQNIRAHMESCRDPSSADCKSSTFQVVLVVDKTLRRTISVINYLHMRIPIHESYQAGLNGGFGREWVNVIPCHGRCDKMTVGEEHYLSKMTELKGSDVVGRFILDVGGEIVVRGGCLPDEFDSGVLEVYPREVGMYGGEKLELSGKCVDMSTPIFCRFGDSRSSPVVKGIMVNSMRGYCPVPPLTKTGPMWLGWSTDQYARDWNTDRSINVVLPGRMEPTVSVPRSMVKEWVSRDADSLTVVWDPNKFTESAGRVDIRLIGYKESQSGVEYRTLETLGTTKISEGRFTFQVADHRCKSNCLEFEIGLIEIALPPEYLAYATERVAVRHGEIPLGWYINEKMTEDNGTNWSDDLCKAWHEQDGKQTDWLSNLLPCPCTVDQALADFGRFQPDPGCNLFTGSVCTYHINAKHCVRSVVPTREGAGNQCCYDHTGFLRYSQLTYQGSTPDRSHSWGAAPYGKPDFVPSLSHWKHDVVSFYYCCLWNNYDLCDLYMERRPTQDCKDYVVPAIASLRGVSHVTTFDGEEYQMLGTGDFYLFKSSEITIQGRFGPRRGGWDLGTKAGKKSFFPQVLTSIGLMYRDKLVDVYLSPESTDPYKGLDIRVNHKRCFFVTKSTMWQDFGGISITNNALPSEENLHNNITILTNNNIGINVVGQNGLLEVTVVLPPEMKFVSGSKNRMGLLGTFDNNPSNDFLSKDGILTPPGVQYTKFLENFVYKWKVESERDTLFPSLQAASNIDSVHTYSLFDVIPHEFDGAPSEDEINALCGESDNCRWDYRITGSPDVAMATLKADRRFAYSQESAIQSDSCGLPPVGRNAIMDNYNFGAKSAITVTGCKEGMSFAGSRKYDCVKETMSDARKHNRDDYGKATTDLKDSIQYLIHWLPRPTISCSYGSASGGLELWMIIAIAAGGVVLLTIAIIIAIVVMKRRKNSESLNSTRSKPTQANRRSAGNDYDPRSGQPMLSREKDRSPVYKPSRDHVQIEGSTV